MSLTTVTGISINEIADEVMVSLSSIINETLYESGVTVEEIDSFKKTLIDILIDNMEELIE